MHLNCPMKLRYVGVNVHLLYIVHVCLFFLPNIVRYIFFKKIDRIEFCEYNLIQNFYSFSSEPLLNFWYSYVHFTNHFFFCFMNCILTSDITNLLSNIMVPKSFSFIPWNFHSIHLSKNWKSSAVQVTKDSLHLHFILNKETPI